MAGLVLSIAVLATITFDDAYAATTISDQASCESISGIWNGADPSCTLTTNLSDEIIIGIDNLILDCNDNVLDGGDPTAGIGILATSRNNITIKNCNVTGYSEGISLNFVFDSTITGNNSHHNGLGMRVNGSDRNMIFENVVNHNNSHGMFAASSGERSDFNTIKDNTANQNGNIGIFWPFGGNNDFEGNSANHNSADGFLVRGSLNDLIDNTANHNGRHGINVDNGDDNDLIDNTANHNGNDGIDIDPRTNRTNLNNNQASHNEGYGYDDDGTDSIFTDNKCVKNSSGGSDPSDLCSPQS